MSVKPSVEMISPQFADLAPGDVLVAEPQHEQDAFDLGRHIVCVFETGTLTLTPALWGRLRAKHRALGRMLTEQELKAVVGAEAGHDRDA